MILWRVGDVFGRSFCSSTFPTNLIDYRDRASVLIWVVLMGLAAQRFLALPERSFTAILLGSPVTLSITDSAILGALLAGLVASGTEAVLRAHPNSLRRRRVASARGLSGVGDRASGSVRLTAIIGCFGVCRLL